MLAAALLLSRLAAAAPVLPPYCKLAPAECYTDGSATTPGQGGPRTLPYVVGGNCDDGSGKHFPGGGKPSPACDATKMTNEMCAAYCVEELTLVGAKPSGLFYSGTQDGSQCWCGREPTAPGTTRAKQPQASCNSPCPGEVSAMCGGGWLNSVSIVTCDPAVNWGWTVIGLVLLALLAYVGVFIQLEAKKVRHTLSPLAPAAEAADAALSCHSPGKQV